VALGAPVEVTAAGARAVALEAAREAVVPAVAVEERVVVGKVLAMAVVLREVAMDLETLERGVAAERAQEILSISLERKRKAKAPASLWRGRGHSTCCQQDAEQALTEQSC